MHIVPDALGDGFPLQLAEHRSDVHHGPAHGAGGVEAFPDGDKVDAQTPQFLNQGGKITDVAADPVQTVNHHRPEPVFAGSLHHTPETRAVQIAAGKTFVFKYAGPVGTGIPESGADIGPAQLHLIADAFALAGKTRLAGIDGNGILVCGHGTFPLPMALYAALPTKDAAVHNIGDRHRTIQSSR